MRRCGLRCPCQRDRPETAQATAACALLDDAGVSRSKARACASVHNRYQVRGGEDVAVDDEIEALRRAGIEVIARIVENDGIGGLPAKLRAALGTAHSASGVRLVREAIRDTRPDVLHAHNFFPLLSPAIHAAAQAEGVATVQTLH